jgi:ribulose 1,5-bisphosphate synthetase/thiazole synthase
VQTDDGGNELREVVMDLTKEREGVEHNVVVIGGSPAGLSAAIRLKQLAAKLGMGSRSLRRSPRSARIFCLAR